MLDTIELHMKQDKATLSQLMRILGKCVYKVNSVFSREQEECWCGYPMLASNAN